MALILCWGSSLFFLSFLLDIFIHSCKMRNEYHPTKERALKTKEELLDDIERAGGRPGDDGFAPDDGLIDRLMLEDVKI